MDNEEISKDEALENAIITSLENPRHCLYYREPKDRTKIAKTLINASEIYELPIHERYEISINAHEQTHIISANQTQFKRMMVLEGINPSLDVTRFSFPMKVKYDRSLTDLNLIYNSEVEPFLEAFATIYQCRLQATPNDLKEYLLIQFYSSKPSLYALSIDIEEIFEKIMAKYEGKGKMIVKALNKQVDKVYLSPAIFGMIMNLTFSTPNIINERILDRFRLIRDIEKIPKWKNFEEITEYFIRYFQEHHFSVSFMSLGTPESILNSAYFLSEIKNADFVQETLEPYIFGLLSEIDTQFGRITYICDSLATLEGKRIKKCYMGSVSRDLLFSSIEVTIRNIDEMLQSRDKIYIKHFDLLREFREDLTKLKYIKEKTFNKCLRGKSCIEKTECPIKGGLCKAMLEEIL